MAYPKIPYEKNNALREPKNNDVYENLKEVGKKAKY